MAPLWTEQDSKAGKPGTFAEAIDAYEANLKAHGGDLMNAIRVRYHRPDDLSNTPRALGSAAIALFDMRPASMQRSMCGRSVSGCAAAFVRLVSACLQIAELGAACPGGGKGLAYALADRRSCSAAAAST